ncbi:MAG: anthranilate synthase component I family protein [Candidatus Kerfeldbacteria bacterium]|nr:anthranilate synthase component I family protein [Candidatus Kerfeldbacteria bacterium]
MFYRKFVQSIDYQPASTAFRAYSEAVPGILFESVDVAPIYGRKNVWFVDPIVAITEQAGAVQFESLHPAGDIVRQQLTQSIPTLRSIFEQIHTPDPYFGLYGLFSYDYVRRFETLPDLHARGTVPDFQLYIPDVIFVYDHLKETAEVHYYQLTQLTLAERLQQLPEQAQQYMKIGDVFELVLSRRLTGSFAGSALGLYDAYRNVNPSPYMFFIRTPQRTIVGASPEMFVRVEDGEVMTRPISGTAARSMDPIADYEHMLTLLNSPKEKSELDMLIDLARNDVARVCQPGITVSDYRYVEKYSKVMHTIAQVTGRLDTSQYLAFDALVACLNAGTLTGAPKIRAMELIEQLEPERRGCYGGCVGYITFNNELNTGITIRSAVIEDATITIQAGATVLYDSNPTAEFTETEHKAAALLQAATATL